MQEPPAFKSPTSRFTLHLKYPRYFKQQVRQTKQNAVLFSEMNIREKYDGNRDSRQTDDSSRTFYRTSAAHLYPNARAAIRIALREGGTMNEIRILLLASNNAKRISAVARHALSLPNGNSGKPLDAAIGEVEMEIGIIAKNADGEPPDFFARQIDRIYQCFGLVVTDFEGIKAATLRRIKASGSLVILTYSVPDEKPEKEEVVNDLEKALLSEFDGLLLADFGSKLLDKDSRVVFDAEGRSDLADDLATAQHR